MSKFVWDIDDERERGELIEIKINEISYFVSEDTACLSHCLALLHDIIGDLNATISCK